MRPFLVSGAATLVLVSAATPPAAVRIVDRDPLTFKDLHFKAGERVRLVVTLKRTTTTHKLHAGAGGPS